MTIILDGRKVANKIKQEIKEGIDKLGEKPCLAVILIGEDSASKVYVNMKQVACKKVGIISREYKFSKEDMIKDGTVVIDVGVNRVGGSLCGDVDFKTVKKKTSYITPVPGGVGPMTIAMLMENTYKAYKNKQIK